MPASQVLLGVEAAPTASSWTWVEPSLGVLTGTLGGVLQSRLLPAPLSHCMLLGGIFGLIFGMFFAKRATTPGAGLIWGLSGA